MNKILATILILAGIALIAYNVTLVDFNDPLQGGSTIALIGIVASLCAILLILIFQISKKIQDKVDRD